MWTGADLARWDIGDQEPVSRITSLFWVWIFQGLAWKNFVGYNPREKGDSGELVDFQGSSPLHLRMVLPDMQEVKQKRQQAWMNAEEADETI